MTYSWPHPTQHNHSSEWCGVHNHYIIYNLVQKFRGVDQRSTWFLLEECKCKGRENAGNILGPFIVINVPCQVLTLTHDLSTN